MNKIQRNFLIAKEVDDLLWSIYLQRKLDDKKVPFSSLIEEAIIALYESTYHKKESESNNVSEHSV